MVIPATLLTVVTVVTLLLSSVAPRTSNPLPGMFLAGGCCLVQVRDQQVMRQVIVRRAVLGFEITLKVR